MNHSNEPNFAKGDSEADPILPNVDEYLNRPELRALEERLRNARAEEVEAAVTELDTAPTEQEALAEQQFVAQVKEQWLEETRADKAPSLAASLAADPSPAAAAGMTALLTQSDPTRAAALEDATQGKPWTSTALSFSRWPMAAAAALLMWAGWSALQNNEPEPNVVIEPTAPVYLGPATEQDSNAASAEGTRLDPLPEELDFSSFVPPMDSYRIVIHDVSKTPRIDDLGGKEELVYEPVWICSDGIRASLPEFVRLEVHGAHSVPGAQPLWFKLFAR